MQQAVQQRQEGRLLQARVVQTGHQAMQRRVALQARQQGAQRRLLSCQCKLCVLSSWLPGQLVNWSIGQLADASTAGSCRAAPCLQYTGRRAHTGQHHNGLSSPNLKPMRPSGETMVKAAHTAGCGIWHVLPAPTHPRALQVGVGAALEQQVDQAQDHVLDSA